MIREYGWAPVGQLWRRRESNLPSGKKTLIFQGEHYGVWRLAEHIPRNVESPYFNLQWKLAFEASTGRGRSPWYQDKKLKPHTVAVSLEAFLESDESAGFQGGVRYFFGHRIDAP
ncbi:hypothetical protein D7Y13_02375 [Corallococcus praedator]|uniref:Uncharacterized protein n=1 Tax=Corallococcus praedator TaxID=2316724 RepID=A0ABX9QQS6_9BACT|nr:MULTISPECIES: hypothetical protein [Corallococcus]RKH35275.1 hypothetical protein D7X75_05140 [Corallococcus sp. CA031C]RKI16393.1 hypothetical protein D7Y13_02375 [Corallococcus praedator]